MQQVIELKDLLTEVMQIATQAGNIILEHYQQPSTAIRTKEDSSPVTDADMASHDFIVEQLNKLTPTIPVISEEAPVPDLSIRSQWTRLWIVDPLDGTKGFIRGNGEFAVNIALIEQNAPILGVVYVPTEKICYAAACGLGASKIDKNNISTVLHTRKGDIDKITLLTSRHHGNPALQKLRNLLPQHDIIQRNSSLKFGLLAAGVADLYPRFAPTCEWDTAAGQCIVVESGGLVTNANFQALTYNDKPSMQNPNFIAIGDPNFAWKTYF